MTIALSRGGGVVALRPKRSQLATPLTAPWATLASSLTREHVNVGNTGTQEETMAISNVKNPPSLSGSAAPPKAPGSEAAKGAASAATAASATATSASSALKAATQGYAKVGATPLVKDAAAVSISPRAKEMSLARALVDETPDVREDKVAEFKKRIASGEYKPDAGRIADGILSEAMKDELSKKPDVALE